jgi:hypothetical protein
LKKKKELLRMKQQENEHIMRISELQCGVREAKDDILQNGSEKMQNWLHNDSDSICEDVRSQKSGAVGDRRQHKRVTEVPRSLVNVQKKSAWNGSPQIFWRCQRVAYFHHHVQKKNL